MRLDANECPALYSPDALAELARAMTLSEPNRYPDGRVNELRSAIADRCDAHADEILVGAGSDEVIAMILTALNRPRNNAPAPTAMIPTPTFVMYKQSARVRGFKVIDVPLDAAYDLDADAMIRGIAFARPNVIFIASPNSPTSALLARDRIESVIEAAHDALVVIDEAYIDFAPRSQQDLRSRYPNVAILRTLSKIGFAALRVGWMIGPAGLVREIDKVRQPYNIPAPSQRGATFVLRSMGAEINRVRELVVAERGRLTRGLRELGFGVADSDANFLWVEAKSSAGELAAALAARGVSVKSFHATGGRLARRLRITVGAPDENDRLLAELARCA